MADVKRPMINDALRLIRLTMGILRQSWQRNSAFPSP